MFGNIPTAPGKHHPDAYHEAFAQYFRERSARLPGCQVSARGLGQATSDQLIRTTKLEEQLVTLENIVHRLAVQMLDEHDSPRAGALGRNIMESIDFMVLTAIDAIESKDSGEIATLEMLTQDRSAMMTKIRHNYFESEQESVKQGSQLRPGYHDFVRECRPYSGKVRQPVEAELKVRA